MKHIGEMLIDEGLITRYDLSRALELQKNNNILLGEALITIDAITKDKLKKFLLKHRDHNEINEWFDSLLDQDDIDKLASQ